MSGPELVPYIATWLVVAAFAAVVIHHIHHVLKGGHHR